MERGHPIPLCPQTKHMHSKPHSIHFDLECVGTRSCITAFVAASGTRQRSKLQGDKLNKFRSADNLWVSQAIYLLPPFVFDERHHGNAVRKPVSCQFLGAYLPMLHGCLLYPFSFVPQFLQRFYCVPIVITRTCNPIWCDCWFIHR